MAVLLELNDTVHNVIQIRYAQPKAGNVHNIMSTPVLSENMTVGQPVTITDNLTTDYVTASGSNTTHTAAVSVATPFTNHQSPTHTY